VTLLEERPSAPPPREARRGHAGGLVGWVTTTDHKKIGILYMGTAFAFFLLGGVLGLLMRFELAQPGRQLVGEPVYNQLFTMHGSVMMFLFAVPMAFGFANYLVPLQLGAPDMAFPRLNSLSYWLYLGGGLTMVSGFLSARGAAQFGWTAYTPLSDAIHSPGSGADLWIMGVVVTGVASILTAVNLITTVFCLRAPGMTMFRMPIFTWNMFIVSAMVILAFPVLTAGLSLLYADRHLGSHFFDAPGGGQPVLWQHIFWFFGHPEVYIVALPFFSAVTFLIAVPTGVKMFNWIATMWRGHLTFESPMLFCVGFLLVFLIGGLTGPMLAAPPVDFHVTDTYFVVAHMHYVLFGTAAFGFFAGLYFWYPKVTGRRLSEPLAKAHFWTMLVGFNLTFWPHHLLGLRGMPRRVPDYSAESGLTFLNLVSSVGAAILGLGTLILLWNLWLTPRKGLPAGDDPWGGNSLEWATSSPPPEHNFHQLPRIRSERPVFDARQKAAGGAPMRAAP